MYKKNTVLLIFCHGINILVNFLLVSVVLNYLGVDEYGVWITITTLVAWLSFFDIGLGHGLRNKYAEARARDNTGDARRYVSTAFFILVAISAVLWILLIAAILLFSCSDILGAPAHLENVLKVVMGVMITTFCIRFVVNIVFIIKTAEQKPATASVVNSITNIFSLLIVVLLTRLTVPSLLYIGIGFAVAQVLPITIAFVFFFCTIYRPIRPSLKFVSSEYMHDIFSLGIRFFIIQLTALVLYQSNNIIIAHVCGMNDVTVYNISYKYLWVLGVVFTAVLTPMWSASTEAYVKGDIEWIRKSIGQLNKIRLVFIGWGVLMVALSPVIYQIWLKGKLKPDFLLMIILLLYFLFYIKHSIYRNFMNGIGKIQLQFYVTLIQSALHIPLTILLGSYFGIYGVVSVMLLWSIVNSIWEPYQFRQILAGKAKGVWSK